MPITHHKSNNPAGSSLGRAIINSREKQPTARQSKKANDPDGAAGYIQTKSKEKVAKSILEENDLDEFLAKADLAGTNFEAEHMNVKFISVDDHKLIEANIPNERRSIEEAQEKLKGRLRIPRRPVWNSEMSANELQTIENKSFLEWRRELASLELEEHILLTPFERNLEVWRQLWRVIERSDIIVQIVDARNPLLFRCYDLEAYVKETDPEKINFILINKADLLSSEQRRQWARYFRDEGIFVAFWSAATNDEEATDQPEEKVEEEEVEETEEIDEQEDESEFTDEGEVIEEGSISGDDEEHFEDALEIPANVDEMIEDGKILNRTQLFDLLKSFRLDKTSTNQTLVVGMVGYPNVGKSSTINKLIGEKKVAVSATPGKTKHFQTLFIDEKFCLCDCPGLVMPSFVINKEQMIVNGILPTDEMRDGTPAIGLIISHIDRKILERTYGIILPKPAEHEDPNRKPTPHELLTAYAFVRGFMSTKGIPDSSRAARIIIKDYVNGRLRYCHAPPGIDQMKFDDSKENEKNLDKTVKNGKEMLSLLQRRHLLDDKPKTADVDRNFFNDTIGMAHVKTGKKSAAGVLSNKKHHNRNKKEKLRRIYGHLDVQ